MLREQLEARGIRDRRVLEAMALVPRHDFVPEPALADAYADRALAIGYGQTISQPYMVGLTAQALALAPDETVLEVGVGSGYMAAVLARLCNWVVGVELVPELAAEARERLAALGIDHVEVHLGDGSQGWLAEAPYDAIVVSAAAPEVPRPLIAQLAPAGRLIMPIGRADQTQELTLLRRQAGHWRAEPLCPCRFVPLIEGPDG